MIRREFITLLGGVAMAWPLAAPGSSRAMQVIGFPRRRSAEASDGPPGAHGARACNETGLRRGPEP